MDIAERLQTLRHIVLDMDGTIYLDSVVFDTTLPFLGTLAECGIGYTFITNNNSRSRVGYVEHLRRMGLIIPPESIFTSAHGAVEYLSTELPEVRRVFVLGAPGLVEDLRQGGLEATDERPDAVIVGFDTQLRYERLAQAAYLIKQGLPYLATHPDLVCPTDLPTVLPDCGAICALLKAATGRSPDAVPGKPSAAMLTGVMHSHGLKPSETALIGDRLYTDIRMALDSDVLAVLTLTGEATRDQVTESTIEPDLIVNDLSEFASQLRSARGA